MLDKKKKYDRRVWVRMGWELAAIVELIGAIRSDKDYQAAMDSKTWDRLDTAIYHLTIVRGNAENRMARFIPDWSVRTFYPVKRTELEALVRDFRAKVAELKEDDT